ncbi:MAG: phosphoribosyltransferase family protein [Candidatus Acidiferrales bacterium]
MASVKINPMRLDGPWIEGFVLDFHTISSVPIGYRQYDTKRTELGELLYNFKYRGANSLLGDICDTAEQFVREWKRQIDYIVPAPPSIGRTSQPVVELARELAKRLGIPVCEDALVKVKWTESMKNIPDRLDREKVLKEAVQSGKGDVRGKSVLLFDDLFDTGSTLRRTAEVLLQNCGAKAVYALALTRTR